MDIDSSYKKLVELAAEKNLDFEFPNSSIEHAKYVISKIIDKTQNTLLIYSRNLDNPIFNSDIVLDSFGKNNKISVRILLDDQDKNFALKYKALNEKSEVRIPSTTNDGFHYLISDNQRIRICTKEKPHQARVNFNNKLFGEKLNSSFEVMWKSASPIN